jgi:hypothetical protein
VQPVSARPSVRTIPIPDRSFVLIKILSVCVRIWFYYTGCFC